MREKADMYCCWTDALTHQPRVWDGEVDRCCMCMYYTCLRVTSGVCTVVSVDEGWRSLQTQVESVGE